MKEDSVSFGRGQRVQRGPQPVADAQRARGRAHDAAADAPRRAQRTLKDTRGNTYTRTYPYTHAPTHAHTYANLHSKPVQLNHQWWFTQELLSLILDRTASKASLPKTWKRLANRVAVHSPE